MFSDVPALKSNEASFEGRLHSRCDESTKARLDVSAHYATISGVYTYLQPQEISQAARPGEDNDQDKVDDKYLCVSCVASKWVDEVLE